jgi:hypothetical protein
MLQKIKASTIMATSNIDFFFRYNHFYGVSYAFFSYDGGLAIFQACRVRQMSDKSMVQIKNQRSRKKTDYQQSGL